MTRAIATALLALGLVGPAVAEDEDKDNVFVGYVFGQTPDIDFQLYTHLCHAFLTADADGRLRPGRSVPDRDLTTRAHEAGVKVLISLGGWGWDEQFAAMAADPAAEDRYVAAVLDMVKEHGYDGLDLDWEYPDTEAEVAGFERLARRLREGLDAIGKERGEHLDLTMAASSNPGTLRWLRTEFLVETLDWVNVMTYDYSGDWTSYAGHHSPLHASSKAGEGRPRSTEATIDYLLEERKLPADRIALGIPLYGKGFAVGEPYASTKDAPKRRLPRGDYANLQRLQAEEGWARRWDAETQNPWLIAPDGTAVIGYDDPESAALKGRFAREKGLRGVFFWQVRGDRLPDGSNPVQRAAREAFFGRSEP